MLQLSAEYCEVMFFFCLRGSEGWGFFVGCSHGKKGVLGMRVPLHLGSGRKMNTPLHTL